MKKWLFHIVSILLLIHFSSCKKRIDKVPFNTLGFETIEKEIKNKFGNDAYFTELRISFDEETGNKIEVTVTQTPELLKMEEWDNKKSNWVQHSEITFETPKGMKASDFMFQLNDEINLHRFGEYIEKSKENLKEKQQIHHTILDIAFIKFPKNGDLSKTEFIVKLKPENKNTVFTFNYPLNKT